MKPKNTEEDYWLALMRAPGVGPVKFAHLVKHFGSPRDVFEAEQLEWHALNLKKELLNYLQNPDWYAVEKDIEWLAQPGHYLLTQHHPDYPPLLREIDSPPPLLFVHGDCALLSSKQLAMVGTRKPTPEGERTAREFAEYLSHQGLTITSGMAYGIDGASHWGALAGSGKTIAVAGTGLDRVYPAKHRELAHKIAQTGALVSELPPDTPVQRSHFPIRSRIVSGLSLGTLVIEAPKNSGALYTARHAQKQGRETFAIPGSIHNPLTKGCHKLIKEGAKLVEKAADILEELRIYRSDIAEPQTTMLAANPTTTESLESPTGPTPTERPESPTGPTPTEKPKLPAGPTPTERPESSANPTINEKPAPQMQRVGTHDLDNDYACLLNYLESGPTSIDNLVEHTQLTAGEVSSMLLILELRGQVAVQTGGLYARIE